MTKTTLHYIINVSKAQLMHIHIAVSGLCSPSAFQWYWMSFKVSAALN